MLSDVTQLFGGDLHAVVEAARVADAVGIHQICLPDHLAIAWRTDLYPGGAFHYPATEPWGEPLTLLTAISQVTSQIRLCAGVLLAATRPALVLAKTVATLDVLSRGRVDLGVGTGWQQEEFEAAGVEFTTRGHRLDDTLRACRVLWRDAPAAFESDTVSFRDLYCYPQPVQREIPIWVGGEANRRNVARIAELAVGWMPILSAASPDVEIGIERLHQAFAAAGRDPNSLKVRAGLPMRNDAAGKLDLDASLAGLETVAQFGVTHVSVGIEGFVHSADEVRPFLERLGGAASRLS